MVDPWLLRRNEPWLQKTHSILDEMVSRGNLIAGLRKSELQQLDETLTRLHTTSRSSATTYDSTMQGSRVNSTERETFRDVGSDRSQTQFEPLRDWNSEEGLSGDKLIAVADSLHFTDLDWLSAAPLGHLDGCLY